MELSQYVLQALREDHEFVLYRGEHSNQLGSPSVLLLAPASMQPALATLKKIEHEYSLRSQFRAVSFLHLRRDLFRQRHRGLDFNLARQSSCSYWRRDFQDAVHIFRHQLFDIYAFGQSKGPLKDAVSDLALKKLGFFHTMGDFPFATNRKQVALCMDLHILRLDARQRYAANVLLRFFVHIGFHCRIDAEGPLELWQFQPPRLAHLNTIEHVVAFATNAKQIFEQSFCCI